MHKAWTRKNDEGARNLGYIEPTLLDRVVSWTVTVLVLAFAVLIGFQMLSDWF